MYNAVTFAYAFFLRAPFTFILLTCCDVLISNCYLQLGPKFMKDNGLKHVTFSTADGALEAAPAVRITFVDKS